MKETDFPTKNCRSAKRITQLTQVLKRTRRSWLKCTFSAPRSTLRKYTKDIIYV